MLPFTTTNYNVNVNVLSVDRGRLGHAGASITKQVR